MAPQAQPTKYYGVKNGVLPAIYATREECNTLLDQTDDDGDKWPGKCEKFLNMQGAEKFVYGTFLDTETHYSDGGDVSCSALVFIDGSCLRNGIAHAAAGIGMYWGCGHQNNVGEPLRGHQSASRAYIIAALRAVSQAKRDGYSKVILCTKNKYLVKGMTEMVGEWEENGWKKPNGQPLSDHKDLQRLIRASAEMEVTWVGILTEGWGGLDGAAWLAKDGAKKCDKLIGKPKPKQRRQRRRNSENYYDATKE